MVFLLANQALTDMERLNEGRSGASISRDFNTAKAIVSSNFPQQVKGAASLSMM